MQVDERGSADSRRRSGEARLRERRRAAARAPRRPPRSRQGRSGPGRFHLPGGGKVVVPPVGEGLEMRGSRPHVTVSLGIMGHFSPSYTPGRGNGPLALKSRQDDHTPFPLVRTAGSRSAPPPARTPDVGALMRTSAPPRRSPCGRRPPPAAPHRRRDRLRRGRSRSRTAPRTPRSPSRRGRVDLRVTR